jgi:hypothetical protein
MTSLIYVYMNFLSLLSSNSMQWKSTYRWLKTTNIVKTIHLEKLFTYNVCNLQTPNPKLLNTTHQKPSPKPKKTSGIFLAIAPLCWTFHHQFPLAGQSPHQHFIEIHQNNQMPPTLAVTNVRQAPQSLDNHIQWWRLPT